jgi:hypothetical protein
MSNRGDDFSVLLVKIEIVRNMGTFFVRIIWFSKPKALLGPNLSLNPLLIFLFHAHSPLVLFGAYHYDLARYTILEESLKNANR